MSLVSLQKPRPVTLQLHRGFLGSALASVTGQKHRLANSRSMSISAGLFDPIINLFKGGDASTSSNDNVLKWARTAKPGCPLAPESPPDPSLQIATFAGGCFWGLELAYQRVEVVHVSACLVAAPTIEMSPGRHQDVCRICWWLRPRTDVRQSVQRAHRTYRNCAGTDFQGCQGS